MKRAVMYVRPRGDSDGAGRLRERRRCRSAASTWGLDIVRVYEDAEPLVHAATGKPPALRSLVERLAREGGGRFAGTEGSGGAP